MTKTDMLITPTMYLELHINMKMNEQNFINLLKLRDVISCIIHINWN